MSNSAVKKGTWVEIHSIVLKPEERSPKVPEDTKKIPLEMKARGFLNDDAKMGEQVKITTLAGRELEGELVEIDPGFTHTFGPPIMELLTIGNELKKIIQE